MNMAVASKEVAPDDLGNPKPPKRIAGNFLVKDLRSSRQTHLQQHPLILQSKYL